LVSVFVVMVSLLLTMPVDYAGRSIAT